MPHDSAPVLPENCTYIINFWQSKQALPEKNLEDNEEMDS